MITATRPQETDEVRKVSAWVIERNLNDLNEAYRASMTPSAERRHEQARAIKIELDRLVRWFVGSQIALCCDSHSFKLRRDEVVQ